MTPKIQKILAAGGLASVVVGAIIINTMDPPPRERIDVNTGCVQTMSQQPQLVVYRRNQAMTVFQYGFHAVDVVAGTSYSQNGKGKTGLPQCPSPINFVGDCWQSANRLAVNDTWLVWAGAPDMCTAQGLAVAKWNAAISRYQWWGFINGSIDRLGKPLLDGDFAYSPEQPPATTYMKFDLVNKTVVAGNLPEPVTPPVQASVQGFTYTIHPIHPNPIPPQYPGPNLFYWQRHGAGSGTPTQTPIPTVTPVPVANPLAPWIEQLYAEGITGGCGTNPLRYCPTAPVSRQEMAVFLLKTKHGSNYAPPPCTGVFVDVPCQH